MHIIRSFTLLTLLALGACQIPQAGNVNNATLLEQAKGPKVEGVEATLLDSAAQAEKAGDYNRAALFYGQLADKSPGKNEFRVMQGDALRRAGKMQEAQKIFDDLLTKNPKDAAALEGKMLCRFAAGELGETSDLVKQILAIEPERWRTLNVAGILFANRQMVDEALAYYERALSYSKDNPSILNNVGLTLAMDKQYDKAIEALTKASGAAIAGTAQRSQIDMNLALVHGVSGNMEMAEKIASQHLSGPALYNNLGYYAKLSKNTTAARDYFNMALTKSPTYYARAWNNLDTVKDKSNLDVDRSVKVKAGKPIAQVIPRTREPEVEATPIGDADKAISSAEEGKGADDKKELKDSANKKPAKAKNTEKE